MIGQCTIPTFRYMMGYQLQDLRDAGLPVPFNALDMGGLTPSKLEQNDLIMAALKKVGGTEFIWSERPEGIKCGWR